MKCLKEFCAYKKAAKTILKTNKNANIGVFAHERVDPDGLYSALACCEILKQKGYTNVRFFMDKNSSDMLEEAKNFCDLKCIKFEEEKPLDLAIVLDLSQASRLGIFESYVASAKQIVIFDHHENPSMKCDAIVSKPIASSTGEVLFWALKFLKVKPTQTIATLLYIAIMADTQRLSVAIEGKKVFDATKKLLSYGIDATKAMTALKRKLTKEEMKAIAASFSKMKTFGDVTYFYFDATKKSFKIDYEKIKDKATWLFSSLDGVKILLIVVIYEDKVNGSFRSFCDKDVNILAEKLGGGGHKKAAGFTTTLTENYVVKIVEEFYKN